MRVRVRGSLSALFIAQACRGKITKRRSRWPIFTLHTPNTPPLLARIPSRHRLPVSSSRSLSLSVPGRWDLISPLIPRRCLIRIVSGSKVALACFGHAPASSSRAVKGMRRRTFLIYNRTFGLWLKASSGSSALRFDSLTTQKGRKKNSSEETRCPLST